MQIGDGGGRVRPSEPRPRFDVERRVGLLLETWPFPILLVSLVGIALLTLLAPAIVVGDTWLMLMAGREIVEHGLPRTDEITVLGHGTTWTDQQWLAQLVFYGVDALAGIRAVVVLDVAFVLTALWLAFGTARALGASSRSTFLVGLLAVVAGPWGWTIRPQVTALPLYAATLWLLVDGYRNGVRRRTLAVLPLLVLWANLHGSVLLGAVLTMLLAVLTLLRSRPAPRLLPWLLLAGGPLSVLATPYGWDVLAYYDRMLVDAPFADILREWERSTPSGTTALFWTLALLTASLLALRRCRNRLNRFELVVLLITFAGAVQAVRGVIWFALACAALLPRALDGVLTREDVGARVLNRAISLAGLGGLAVALVVALAQPSRWFTEEWSDEQVEAVRSVTEERGAHVFATNNTADWLLWRVPELRGRVAYDSRFELYDEAALERIVDVGRRRPGWEKALAGYDVVVVRAADRDAALRALGAGARVLHADAESAVVARASNGGSSS